MLRWRVRMVRALRLVGEVRQVLVDVGGRDGGLQLVALAQAGHFPLPGVQGGGVFGVGLRGFVCVAAREACVDFVVDGAAEGFADALAERLVKRLMTVWEVGCIGLTCMPTAAAFRLSNRLEGLLETVSLSVSRKLVRLG